MAGAGDIQARFEAATVLMREHRANEALAGFDAILVQAPQHLPTLINRGSALLALRRDGEAEAAWRSALATYPDQEALLWNLGLLLTEHQREPEALALADAVLARQPHHARALMLRGEALTGLSRFEEAIAALQAIPPVSPFADEAQAKQAVAEAGLQRHDDARATLDRVLARAPDYAFALFRRANVRLAQRDFGGWADYEARWRLPIFYARSGGMVTHQIVPRLTVRPSREDLAGQRILLLSEQGVGDVVMFASLLPDLQDLARSIGCVCDARLLGLFRASFPRITFASPGEARVAVSSVDRFVAMGSLAGVFRPDEAAFPGTPYLAPRPEVRARWAARLGARTGKLRIGLSWRGGTPNTRGRQRSVDWDQLAPLLSIKDCEFVSLQYGDVTSDLAAAPVPIRAFPASDIDDFEELAALTAELDLVVSVQTAVVHVCGAIGQTCLTLVPHNAEWRYAASGSTMPWYRSVRIFRQAAPGDWGPVVDDVAATVRARLSLNA